jgi:hypothetical protein
MRSRRLFVLGWIVLAFAWGVSLLPPPALWNVRLVNPILRLLEVPLGATYIPTPIKSITAISITPGGVGSATQAVSVTKTASILYNAGMQGSGNDESNAFQYAVITSDSVVTATSNGNTTAWKGQLIEFVQQFVKSEGCGTATIAATTNTGTASFSPNVTTGKTLLSVTGYFTAFVVGSAARVAESSATFTASTITFTRAANLGSAGDAQTVGYCYVEFK